jgi:hypothetical protein
MDAIARSFRTWKPKKLPTFSHHMQITAAFDVIGAALEML